MSTQSLLMAGPELTETDIAGTEDSTFRPFDDELRRLVDDGKISMKADDLVVRVSGGKVLLDRVTFRSRRDPCSGSSAPAARVSRH